MADMQLPNEIVTYVAGGSSVSVLLAFVISYIRRRASADTKALMEDKSHNSMLESYKLERDEIRADRDRIIDRMLVIENERNEAVSKVGKLTAEVEFLSTQVAELKMLVEKLGNSLELARLEIHKFAIENATISTQLAAIKQMNQPLNESTIQITLE